MSPGQPRDPAWDGQEQADGPRRRFGRLPLETLECNLGTVLDLSAGGMRVLCRKVPKVQTIVEIDGYPMPQPLIANVTWTRRTGLFKHEVGLQFQNVSPEIARVLSQIAGCNRMRRVM